MWMMAGVLNQGASMLVERVLYTAKVHTTGGREGTSSTSDGHLEVKLSSPGGAGAGTNPEQLFAAGWSDCFLSAMKIVAGKIRTALPEDTAIDAEVDLTTRDGGFFLSARLDVRAPGLRRDLVEAVVAGAHQTCPYSKAARGNVDVVINVD
jgi:osmotically inducible protein OsmC